MTDGDTSDGMRTRTSFHFKTDNIGILRSEPTGPDLPRYSDELELLLHQSLRDELGASAGALKMSVPAPTNVAIEPRWSPPPLSQRDLLSFIKLVPETIDLARVIEGPSSTAAPMLYSLGSIVCKKGAHYCVFNAREDEQWEMWECGHDVVAQIQAGWAGVRAKLLGRSFVREKCLGTFSATLLVYRESTDISSAAVVSASLSASRASRVSVLDDAMAAAQHESMRLRSAAGVLERLHAQLDCDESDDDNQVVEVGPTLRPALAGYSLAFALPSLAIA